mmetsp:Transcript_34427/g.99145  ORF Transcript_34427/g.99145 Transcript_34427/m.99145 type:complete len:501 (-) Transcript_34427:108-1610(-)
MVCLVHILQHPLEMHKRLLQLLKRQGRLLRWRLVHDPFLRVGPARLHEPLSPGRRGRPRHRLYDDVAHADPPVDLVEVELVEFELLTDHCLDLPAPGGVEGVIHLAGLIENVAMWLDIGGAELWHTEPPDGRLPRLLLDLCRHLKAIVQQPWEGECLLWLYPPHLAELPLSLSSPGLGVLYPLPLVLRLLGPTRPLLRIGPPCDSVSLQRLSPHPLDRGTILFLVCRDVGVPHELEIDLLLLLLRLTSSNLTLETRRPPKPGCPPCPLGLLLRLLGGPLLLLQQLLPLRCDKGVERVGPVLDGRHPLARRMHRALLRPVLICWRVDLPPFSAIGIHVLDEEALRYVCEVVTALHHARLLVDLRYVLIRRLLKDAPISLHHLRALLLHPLAELIGVGLLVIGGVLQRLEDLGQLLDVRLVPVGPHALDVQVERGEGAGELDPPWLRVSFSGCGHLVEHCLLLSLGPPGHPHTTTTTTASPRPSFGCARQPAAAAVAADWDE